MCSVINEFNFALLSLFFLFQIRGYKAGNNRKKETETFDSRKELWLCVAELKGVVLFYKII